MSLVAIVGSGPGGLVAARYLKHEGFEVRLFESGDHLGGQWSGNRGYSAVWAAMRTNTSRILTAFSDLPHEGGEPAYLHNYAVKAYLRRYAEKFELLPFIRFKTRVREISRAPSGTMWCIRFTDPDGNLREELYSHILVASGRHRKPNLPTDIGLNRFTGKLLHACEFDSTEEYRNRRVLLIGCSVSALEIASELAFAGVRVFSTSRRQRYILPKFLAGVPADHVFFTRAAALALEYLPIAAVMDDLKRRIVSAGGSPDQFGTPKPSADPLQAGITQCQHFLPLVGEGKIQCKAWISGIDGRDIQFCDGSREQVEAIICGTGYRVDLPFLNEEILSIVRGENQHLDLYKSTFHPDLPNLAFLGIFDLFGPYFPVLELQARWIAYVWSGAVSAVPSEQMRRELSANTSFPMHTAALTFARAAGVEPQLDQWPQLARALLFGPLSGISFRLSGRDSLREAAQRVKDEATMFGAIPTPEFTSVERRQLEALGVASGDRRLSRILEISA